MGHDGHVSMQVTHIVERQHVVKQAGGVEETNFHRGFAAAMLRMLRIGSVSLHKAGLKLVQAI